MRFTAELDGVVVMDRAFNRVEEYISDYRNFWPGVNQELELIEQEQFNSEGSHGESGRWAPLSPLYAKYKEITYPGQPILQATGALKESLTNLDAPGAVVRFDEKEMVRGSSIDYAIYHQRGTGRMPARPEFSLNEDDKRRLMKAIQLPLVEFVRRQGFVLEQAA